MFREAVAAIARGAELQSRLIDDVLDVSRIVSGKLRLTRENFDVARVLTAAIEAVRPSADARQVSIHTSFAPSLGSIVADPTRLQQVVWNLLTNAVKFTPKGGTIDVSAQRTASRVQIAVKDTGEGIEPHFLPHVFEPFRQAENPQTRIHGGLGLGLSIVRYIVEAHGGSVTAESHGRGTGATFMVTLPIVAVANAPNVYDSAAETRSARTIDPERLRNLDVLVVEDDPGSREMIRAVLRQAGAHVTTVDSAAGALAQLEGGVPDVIITDIAMPTMDGYALVRELRRRSDTAKATIVALSAFPAGTADKNGFNEYLTKPIEPYDLVEAVAKLRPASPV
jgi:CheY-like chemotaxis protein/anti-sigma regulatory factor (Ser/Thr protein kinase)